MNEAPLWTSSEIEAATGGVATAPFEVLGVTFDSREAGPGDLFVAMPGTATDGHAFVEQALLPVGTNSRGQIRHLFNYAKDDRL